MTILVIPVKAVHGLRSEFDRRAKTWFLLDWAVRSCPAMEVALSGMGHARGLALASVIAGIAAGIAVAQESPSGQDPLRAFLSHGPKAAVPLEEILRGGPPVDGIASLSDPRKAPAKDADGFLRPGDMVLGLAINGEAVAYPIRLLGWHEIANDVVGGIPIAVTYCPLCRSGIVFDRRQGRETVEFGVSGLLYKSDLVLYDRSTRSLWSQILGEAIAGPSTGKSLKRIAAAHATWKEWRDEHPDTSVATFDTGYSRDYGRDPYAGYASSRVVYFPVGRQDPRLHPKEPVFGVRAGDAATAVPERLVREKREVKAALGEEDIVFKFQEGVRAFGKNGDEIPGTSAYWFAWFAFHPGTRLIVSPP